MIDANKPIHVNSMNFDKVIGQGIVLVDFWAAWCSPCKAMEPILDDLAQKLNGGALVAKLNVDDNRSVASKYGIHSIPTIILFNNGKETRRFIGAQSADKLLKLINDLKNQGHD